MDIHCSTMNGLDTILDEILPTVSRPARYVGGEWNARNKSWDDTAIRLALAYPDIYDLGMSNLGLQILYEIANDLPDILCDRAYAPWTDMEAAMRGRGVPLFGLETRRPLADFDVIGFTLPYELNTTNVLNMLDLAGIPVLARERAHSAPLIIAGGSGAYNPEPMADFIDLFAIGDGEEVLADILKVYRDWRRESGPGTPRREFLIRAAAIPGVYAPALYQPDYTPEGLLAHTWPIHPDAPARIVRRLVAPLPPYPRRPPVPYIDTIHNRAMIEIQRGCTQGCRFCQAGILYRPIRERDVEEIVQSAKTLIARTGYSEIGLLSLSSADHSQIEQILRRLTNVFCDELISLSLPSLRLDSFSVELAKLIQGSRRTGLTFAPEAGSQRLRDAINKKVTEADLLETAEAAYSNGWRRIKLYFMIGLPTETLDDILSIAGLVRKVLEVGRRHIGRRAEVAVSVATFVPKPHTPFQWVPLVDQDQLANRIAALRKALEHRGIHLSWHEPITTELEATIARGDRRLGSVIQRAWQLGAKFDAWNEHFKPWAWEQAFAEAGLSMDFFARRPRHREETLPWDHIDAGVRKAFLWLEQERAERAEPLSDCRSDCHGCGILTALDLASCPVAGLAHDPAGEALP